MQISGLQESQIKIDTLVYLILLYLFRFEELARLKEMFLSYLNKR